MQPTILPGDVLFINKLAYDLRVPFTTMPLAHWAEPARGDVVVCFAPDDNTRLRRNASSACPATPSSFATTDSSLTATPPPARRSRRRPAASVILSQPERTTARFAREHLGAHAHAMMVLPGRPALRDFGPVRVPTGHYLMLGDNRDNSRDSRFFGFMPRAEIIGEAKAVVVSADLNHWLRPRFNRFFTALDCSRCRR